MSAPGDTATESNDDLPSADSVARYLLSHPKFLQSRPEILHELGLKQSGSEVASLVERQISKLREENANWKAKFLELVDLAKANQELIGRIHQLALALMSAPDPQAIFKTLGNSLKKEFHADEVRTLVFADAGVTTNDGAPEFVGQEASVASAFSDVIDSGAASCGPLDAAQAGFVFANDDVAGSAALLPLPAKAWNGLLIIASRDAERFNAQMGTEFLTYLGDIVALVIDPWVARNDEQ